MVLPKDQTQKSANNIAKLRRNGHNSVNIITAAEEFTDNCEIYRDRTVFGNEIDRLYCDKGDVLTDMIKALPFTET